MKPVKFFAVFALMLIISIATEAQSVKSRIQQRRIAEGVRSGELTRHETRLLGKQQRRIRHERREACADGVVTPGERREIRRDKRYANRNIFRKKHNRRDRI